MGDQGAGGFELFQSQFSQILNAEHPPARLIRNIQRTAGVIGDHLKAALDKAERSRNQ